MNTANDASAADILKTRISFRNQRYDRYLYRVWTIRHNLARNGYDLAENTLLQDGTRPPVSAEIGRLLCLQSQLKQQMRRDLEMMQTLRWRLKDEEAKVEHGDIV